MITLLDIYDWLFRPLKIFVKPRVVPNNPKEELGIGANNSVLYVLPSKSYIDLVVLRFYCKKNGLPVPRGKVRQLAAGASSAYLYLTKLGMLQPKRNVSAPQPLLWAVQNAQKNLEFEIDIVPVSIIWGRNPGRKEKSFFKLIFSDNEHAGWLRKLLVVIVQGRDALVNFGKPISLRKQISEGSSADQVARKLRRVMRVHFTQQRRVTQGPMLYDRGLVTRELLRIKSIRQQIEKESSSKKISKAKAENRARRYIREISSEPRHNIVRAFAVVLRYVWNKIFKGVEVIGAGRVRELAETHEIVYMSAHRSHVDYLLLSYVLFEMGMNVPHTAAGINLNFWPIGPFLRRGGGFFLRRSFGSNRLYTTVFNEYISFLLRRGHSINFFPEGGRSRTGRLLQPKTGMLAMIIQGYMRTPERPVKLVPVYVGYDSVVEIRSYMKELQGAKKKSENMGQLLRARKIMKANYGKVYLSFGEAIDLDDYLNKAQPDWKSDPGDHHSKPQWLHTAVETLARKTMEGINDAAVASPVALVATVMLATSKRSITEENLVSGVGLLIRLLNGLYDRGGDRVPVDNPVEAIAYAEKYSNIQRFKYPGSDVLFLDEADAILMSYYRNNLLHLFVIPSLIAQCFVYRDSVARSEVNDVACLLMPFIAKEYLIEVKLDDGKEEVNQYIDWFIENDLLIQGEKGELLRPSATTVQFSELKILSGLLNTTFERYGIILALLNSYSDELIVRSEFEDQCRLLAQRISLLSGASDPEIHDKALYKNFLDQLRQKNLLVADNEDLAKLRVSPDLKPLISCAMSMLSRDVIDSIRRT